MPPTIIIRGPSKNYILVTYSLIILPILLASAALFFALPTPGSVPPVLIGLWFLFCAALLAWSGLTYKQPHIREEDGSLIFVRAGSEYLRITINDITRAHRSHDSIWITTKQDQFLFRASDMHDNRSDDLLWAYLAKAMGQPSTDSRELIRST